MQQRVRSLDELLDKKEPAWIYICSWIQEASNAIEVLPATEPNRSERLHQLQVTTRSAMGAVVYETGGILIDHGWLRLLGSGHEKLPRSLPKWNEGRSWTDLNASPPFLLIGDDVVGGFFAVNGGALPGPPGHVFYFAPDTLEWEDMGVGYSDFLQWTMNADFNQFYKTHRWPNWEADMPSIHGDQGFLIYPFLWADGPGIEERTRKPVPISELYSLQMQALP